MAIPRLDFFNFLFNGGRGINTNQIDWSVSDTELTALLSSLGAAGNTAYALTAAPDDADGADGDVAVALLSATELAGYTKAGGAWTQAWTFSGGGGGAISFAQLTGMIADSQIPAAIMRDAEFTAAAVRGLLNLTATEVNDLSDRWRLVSRGRYSPTLRTTALP